MSDLSHLPPLQMRVAIRARGLKIARRTVRHAAMAEQHKQIKAARIAAQAAQNAAWNEAYPEA